MKKIYSKYLILIALLVASLISCQKDFEVIKIKAFPPTVDKLEVVNQAFTYSNILKGSVKITDNEYNLKQVILTVSIDGSNVYTKTFPIESQKEFSLSLETLNVTVPFGVNADELFGEVIIEAQNIKLKTVKESVEIELNRPKFDKLYVNIEDTDYVMNKTSDDVDAYTYSATIAATPNGTEAYIYSMPNKQGVKWGYDNDAKACKIDSDVPIPLYDSDNGTITKIGFDAYSFVPSPLEKAMAVGGKTFAKYSDEGKNTDGLLKISALELVKDANVEVTLMDLDQVLFDPDFFEKVDATNIKYTGETGSVNLYYNTEFKFVFVESATNPFTTTGDALDKGDFVIIMASGGVAVPSLAYGPGWSHTKGIAFRKVASSDATAKVYTQTIVANYEAYFAFYNTSGWGHAKVATEIDYTPNTFIAEKESGKESYIIALEDKSPTKAFIYKVTLTLPTSGNATLEAVKRREIVVTP